MPTVYIGAPHMNSGRSARATAPTHAAVVAHTSPAQKAHRLAPTKVMQHVHGKNVNRKKLVQFSACPRNKPKEYRQQPRGKKINKYAPPSHSYSGVAARANRKRVLWQRPCRKYLQHFDNYGEQHRFMHATVPYFFHLLPRLSAQLQKNAKVLPRSSSIQTLEVSVYIFLIIHV